MFCRFKSENIIRHENSSAWSRLQACWSQVCSDVLDFIFIFHASINLCVNKAAFAILLLYNIMWVSIFKVHSWTKTLPFSPAFYQELIALFLFCSPYEMFPWISQKHETVKHSNRVRTQRSIIPQSVLDNWIITVNSACIKIIKPFLTQPEMVHPYTN